MSLFNVTCASNKKRERGNTLYARAEFSRAVDVYTKYVCCQCLLLSALLACIIHCCPSVCPSISYSQTLLACFV